MALLEILTVPNPILRQEAAPVKEVTAEIKKLLDDMAETMYAAPGIGLAGPQVGALLQVIVVDIGQDKETGAASTLYKLVNPKIVHQSGETSCEEGCLSVPGIREYVKRAESITVEALDQAGKEVKIEASGLLAVCIQHEIDHLNGKLFTDHLSRLKRQLLKAKLPQG